MVEAGRREGQALKAASPQRSARLLHAGGPLGRRASVGTEAAFRVHLGAREAFCCHAWALPTLPRAVNSLG